MIQNSLGPRACNWSVWKPSELCVIPRVSLHKLTFPNVLRTCWRTESLLLSFTLARVFFFHFCNWKTSTFFQSSDLEVFFTWLCHLYNLKLFNTRFIRLFQVIYKLLLSSMDFFFPVTAPYTTNFCFDKTKWMSLGILNSMPVILFGSLLFLWTSY